MRYLQRDETGAVTGHYANPQPGIAEEAVADDHPALLAYIAARGGAALRAIQQKQEEEALAVALADPNAPVEVKEYAKLLEPVEIAIK